jgi:hypothetical protein
MFAAGAPAVGFESVHPHSAGRVYPTRYTLGGGDQLVRLGDVGAFPYEVEAANRRRAPAHLGDVGVGPPGPWTWPWPISTWAALGVDSDPDFQKSKTDSWVKSG